jgi:tetratricopeptide (TPR) repeat protein
MYIKRRPLGEGNLRFGKRKRRYPVILIILYVLVLAAAVFVFFRLDTIQPAVLAKIGPEPTPTPSIDYYIAQAEAAYYDGELEQAVEYYRQALEMAPEDLQILFELARLLTLTEDVENLEEALGIEDQMILLAPEDSRGYAAKARTLDWMGDYDQAAVEALHALELDPNDPYAHAYLSEAYTDLGQLRQARDEAELSIELDPFNVDARRNYAYVLESYGDYGGAIQQYEQALNLQPNLLDLWYGLARNYRGASAASTSPNGSREMFEKSVETYQQIIMRTPEDPRTYVELGRTYFEVREDDAAQINLERAVSLVCEDCPLHTFEEIEEAGYTYPPGDLPDEIYAPAWLRLGNVYHTRRNYESAIAIYEELIAWDIANDVEVPLEAYLVTASDYYYLDFCDIAVPRAFEALDVYEDRRLDEPVALTNILSVFVLCRDYANTPPTIAYEFPAGYEEPDVYLERGDPNAGDETGAEGDESAMEEEPVEGEQE